VLRGWAVRGLESDGGSQIHRVLGELSAVETGFEGVENVLHGADLAEVPSPPTVY
jgi:hypothetical protein